MFLKIEERQNPSLRENYSETLDDAGRLLLRTAAYIEEHGLSCGGQRDDQGRLCTVRSMFEVGASQRAVDRAIRRLRPHFGEKKHIAHWSDTTPAGEVIATLRRVAGL